MNQFFISCEPGFEDELIQEIQEIWPFLIEKETNRLLSQLLDELKRLGMSLDQYLASRGKTDEQLRSEYDERAEKDLKMEWVQTRFTR